MRVRKGDRQTKCKMEQAAVNKKLHLLEAPGNRQPAKLQSLIGNAFTNRLRVAASLQWSKILFFRFCKLKVYCTGELEKRKMQLLILKQH